MSESLVLGLEFSTQSAKAVALGAETGSMVAAYQLSYDESFPRYGSRGGVLPSMQPEVRHTAPSMLLDGLDELFRRMCADGLHLSRVGAVKLDAQQHCTVYSDHSLAGRLAELSEGEPLAAQLVPAFTRETAPIWEDRSTGREARLLEERLAAHGGIQKLTANRGELRFPASQILKWAREDPASYDRTAHIMLLSAFLTSVLAGRPAPVDTGDGWGTNLNHTDITEPGFNDVVIDVLDEEIRAVGAGSALREKLGEMEHYDAPVGPVSPYFTRAYGLNANAVVLAGTGDNPATLLGCGGNLVISLGSSYTVNGVLAGLGELEGAEYNVFGYIPGHAMALSVITNGTKVHDAFRKRYTADGSWESYAALAGGRTVREGEPLLLPYLQEESVPLRPAGIVRHGFGEGEAMLNVRALHLSQALSLRLHASHVSDPRSLAVVGGGSYNERLRSFITDAFGAETYRIRNGEYAAPLGCAIAAARHVLGIDYDEAASRFVQVEEESRLAPQPELAGVYEKLVARYAELEDRNGSRGA
ncbi:MAG: FGGY-family carbohydrate kinase [Spirochaetaceae bacterium]